MKPYETLGVSSSASQDEIKNAYRNLAKKFHPDLNPGKKDSEKKFKEIAAAYELLGNPESRAKFDRGEFAQSHEQSEGQQRRGGQGPFYHETQQDGGRYSQAFGGMEDDLLRSIFGRMGAKGARGFDDPTEMPGQDVLYRMDVDFRDAVLGAEREITLPSGKRIRVKIPAGVDNGAKLRFQGLGSPGSGKAPPGDAYVELNVKPSTLFKRLGNDLEIELPISFVEAILGAEIKVPTIDGAVLLRIPAGVAAGTRLRIAGKGVSAAGKRGDQYVVVKVMVPHRVDSDLKEAVESWSKRQTYDPRADWAGSLGSGT